MIPQNTLRKTITATINKSDLEGKIDFISPPITLDEKLDLAKSILEIPNNFQDEIDVIFQDDVIVFKWHSPKIDEKAELLHKNALLMARKRNLDEAIRKWTQAASINSSDPDYFFNLGVAYFEKKRYQDAIENLSRVLAICPFYFKTYLILGTAYLKIRKFEFSKKYLTKSILYNKYNALAFLNLGAVNSILKLYDDGIAMFEKAIALSPNEPRAYLGLAKIYSTLGNIEKANEYFKKVIKLDNKGNLANYAKRSIQRTFKENEISNKTGNPEDFYSEGYRCYISGDYTKSALMYKKYLSLKPEDDYIWYALGETQLREGRPELALEAFKQAIRLYPKKGLYFKELAIVFDKLNKPEKVIAAVTKAKELGKSDSITYCLWGKALFQLKNFKEAIMMLEHSLKSNKNNLLAKYYLIESLIQNNEIESAIDYLYELKEVQINTPIKEKAIALYKKINQ